MRETFIKTLEEFAGQDPNIILLTADLGRFFGSFQEKFPKQFINCGVAEENMISVAAGLALSGKKVYSYSIIPFLVMRAFESIKIDICYHNLNVRLLGAGGGLVYGTEGMTHQAIEDIAIMRSLPNMTVTAPGDLLETQAIAKESVNFQGPLYIRFGKDKAGQVHESMPDLKIGKGIILKKGRGAALVCCGSLLTEAKKAAEKTNATLVSMPTIKPIDKTLLRDLAENHKMIFTLEDHSEIGGLGSAVAEVLQGFKGLKKMALPDEYSKYIGSADYLYKCYGLDSESIAKKIYESSIC